MSYSIRIDTLPQNNMSCLLCYYKEVNKMNWKLTKALEKLKNLEQILGKDGTANCVSSKIFKPEGLRKVQYRRLNNSSMFNLTKAISMHFILCAIKLNNTVHQ